MNQMKPNTGRSERAAVAVLMGILLGGCSSGSADIGREGASFLGARDLVHDAPLRDMTPSGKKIEAGKVLSAIAFERVTGLEVDPARLVQP